MKPERTLSKSEARLARITSARAALTAQWQTSAEMGVSHHALKTLVTWGEAECTQSSLRPNSPLYGYRLKQTASASEPQPAEEDEQPSARLTMNANRVELRTGNALVVLRIDPDGDTLFVRGYDGEETPENLLGMFCLPLAPQVPA